ncbi:MAG: trigger factor [Leptospiraceae bacterium]|nr:trigger factor [Leptospiraceae bacterium]
MEYTIDTPNSGKASVQLKFNSQDIEAAFNKAYEKAASKVKIAGFRPGKAPMNIVKKTLGESVTEDALNIMLTDGLKELYPNLGFSPYGQPKINITTYERNEKMEASAEFELMPSVELSNYKNLKIDIMEPDVNDDFVNEEIKKIQFELSKTQSREDDELVEENDYIELELESKDEEGVTLQKNDEAKYYLGIDKNNKEFEENFIGLKKGSERQFNFTYPSTNPNPSFAGKKITYKIKINGVYKVILPEIDDSFAAEWDETYSTLDGLKADILKRGKENFEKALQSSSENHLLAEIVSSSQFSFPESLVREEEDGLFHDMIHRYNLDHMTIEQFAEKSKMDPKEFRSQFTPQAEKNIKNTLAMSEIAKLESISVETEELTHEYQHYIQHYGKPDQYHMDGVIRQIGQGILFKKVLNFIYESADKKVEPKVELARIRNILNGGNAT